MQSDRKGHAAAVALQTGQGEPLFVVRHMKCQLMEEIRYAIENIFAALAVTSLFAAGAAHAGPQVTVTVKNLGTAPAKYSIAGSGGAITTASAVPTPENVIPAKGYDKFVVRGDLSPDITTVFLRYSIAGKTCEFRTSMINTIVPGGLLTGTLVKVPKWDKGAVASGGATCTATLSALNLSNYSWNAEFTIK